MGDHLSEILESVSFKHLAGGFEFTEGPLWHSDGYLLFVDLPRNLILRLIPGGRPEIVREDSGGANGLTFDLLGRLIICEGNARRVTRMESNGDITTIADKWEGKRLNRPNDVVCHSDGSIYFTNPAGRLLDPAVREIEFTGVHRILSDGTVTAPITQFEFPNGLAFSPNEKTFYVANTREAMGIRVFDVTEDGAMVNERVFADMSSRETVGAPDGMKVDIEGNVYCTGTGGCWVFDRLGNHLGIIRLPEVPANCAWGGPENRTMFFTARTSIYSMEMKIPGTRLPAHT